MGWGGASGVLGWWEALMGVAYGRGFGWGGFNSGSGFSFGRPFADSLSGCILFVGACFLSVWCGVDSTEAGYGCVALLGGWSSWEAAAAAVVGVGAFVVGVVGAELSDLLGKRSVLSPFRVSILGYFGEEVTFDYNFVRVFGAAAKKCVCGSSQCRGYIGGDPLNTDVVVQCDPDEEYPEPVMVYRNGKPDYKLKKLLSSTSSSESTEVQITDHTIGNKDKMDKSATAVGHLEITTEIQTAEILVKDETDKSATAVQHLEIPTRKSLNKSASAECLQISLAMDNSVEKLPPSVQQVVTSSQLDDMMGKTISNAKQEFVQRLETSALIVISNKSLSNTIDAKKKCNSDIIEDRCASKSYPLMKTSRLSSSVKKGKLNSNSVNVHKPDMMVNKSPVLPYKPKRIMEGSLNGRLEYVEETLNGLLDADGGISKRKDASKGYLMLLLQTATSGDSGNGEAIQSNRDLSMILDGLLKTKSRMVLVDIINTNGLQMLHNIMKQYRRDFNKIPILRKLLKVLERLPLG
ncbi:hypothetical protein HYC85_007855 [Camellia sinensis]|uniref:Post-SET domain-containing protein n=1 Tax=Camellia sinensis TaxID=4442 RepID=A0A7J7HQS4_CAMSI|nr:hypothetical protein HYC85_007855 [Camellia sinensis]